MAKKIPLRKKIIYPKRRTTSFGDPSGTKYFEEFWKLNGKSLAEQYKYATEKYYRTEEEIKNIFRHKVSEVIQTGELKPRKDKSIFRQAIEKVTRMRSTWGGGWETQFENFKSVLKSWGYDEEKETSEVWEKFKRAKRNKKGQFVKVFWDNMRYEGEGVYTLPTSDGGCIVVDFINSPKDVKILKFGKDEFDIDTYMSIRREAKEKE